MTVALRKPMSREAFFARADAQEERYQFDGVQPVAMTGGNLRHSQFLRDIDRELANRLAGEPTGAPTCSAPPGRAKATCCIEVPLADITGVWRPEASRPRRTGRPVLAQPR